ncbi:MAG: hypothetical protein WAV55_07355 [Clostridiaceae bacterium]
MKNRSMDVIAEFTNGRVIPRKIRYYDVSSASYIEKDVKELSYEVINGRVSRYGVRFTDREERILGFSHLNGNWFFVDHL